MFWDQERYQAARKCYSFMRSIDDLIDNHKAEFSGIARMTGNGSPVMFTGGLT